MSAETTSFDVGGKKRRRDRDDSVAVKTSSFHITLNTNQRYTNKASLVLDMKPLWDALHKIYGSADSVRDFIEIMKPLDTFSSSVGHVESTTGIEYASNGLHAHTLLTLHHTTKLRIAIRSLRNKISEYLPHLTNFYMNVRFVPNQVQTVKNYIFKDVGGKRIKLRDGTPFDTSETMVCKCERKIADMTSFFSS